MPVVTLDRTRIPDPVSVFIGCTSITSPVIPIPLFLLPVSLLVLLKSAADVFLTGFFTPLRSSRLSGSKPNVLAACRISSSSVGTATPLFFAASLPANMSMSRTAASVAVFLLFISNAIPPATINVNAKLRSAPKKLVNVLSTFFLVRAF